MFWMEESKRHIFALWLQSKIALWSGYPMQGTFKNVLSVIIDGKEKGFVSIDKCPDLDLALNCFLNDLITEINI